MRVCDLELLPAVAGDEQGFVTVSHLVRGTEKRKDVTFAVGEGAHAATGTSSGGFGNCKGFALKGFAFVGGASDENGAASFAIGVARLGRMPSDINVSLRI